MKQIDYYKKAVLIATTEEQPGLCGLCHFLLAAQFELDHGKLYDEMAEMEEDTIKGLEFTRLWREIKESTSSGGGSFSELFKYKPKEIYGSGYWFNSEDRETRINILQSIIEELK